MWCLKCEIHLVLTCCDLLTLIGLLVKTFKRTCLMSIYHSVTGINLFLNLTRSAYKVIWIISAASQCHVFSEWKNVFHAFHADTFLRSSKYHSKFVVYIIFVMPKMIEQICLFASLDFQSGFVMDLESKITCKAFFKKLFWCRFAFTLIGISYKMACSYCLEEGFIDVRFALALQKNPKHKQLKHETLLWDWFY